MPGAEEFAAQERAWRDSALSSVMWLRERHRDQLEIAIEASLNGEPFTGLLLYMQVLRDWPQSPDFPATDHCPIAPAWIADQSQ
nr:phage tail assembly chaperone [Pseudomonas sp. B6002]